MIHAFIYNQWAAMLKEPVMPMNSGITNENKMADELVVAQERYGSGSLERSYKFATESGSLERIKNVKEPFGTSVLHFLKV